MEQTLATFIHQNSAATLLATPIQQSVLGSQPSFECVMQAHSNEEILQSTPDVIPQTVDAQEAVQETRTSDIDTVPSLETSEKDPAILDACPNFNSASPIPPKAIETVLFSSAQSAESVLIDHSLSAEEINGAFTATIEMTTDLTKKSFHPGIDDDRHNAGMPTTLGQTYFIPKIFTPAQQYKTTNETDFNLAERVSQDSLENSDSVLTGPAPIDPGKMNTRTERATQSLVATLNTQLTIPEIPTPFSASSASVLPRIAEKPVLSTPPKTIPTGAPDIRSAAGFAPVEVQETLIFSDTSRPSPLPLDSSRLEPLSTVIIPEALGATRSTQETMTVSQVQTVRASAHDGSFAAIATKSADKIDIQLRPDELGSLSIKLDVNRSETVVIISADRPETLELARRQSEVLHSIMQQLGYKNPSFSFQEQGSRNSSSAPDQQSQAFGADDEGSEVIGILSTSTATTLDIRI